MSSKPLKWVGSSQDDLRAFSVDARREAGHQLRRVQEGEEPGDWRSMPTVGAGVREIRLDMADGWYRVFYVASIGDAIYVLHAFEKQSRKTSRSDVEIGKKRFSAAKEDAKEVMLHAKKKD